MGTTTLMHAWRVWKQSDAKAFTQSEPNLILCTDCDTARAPPRQLSREMLSRGVRGFWYRWVRTDQYMHSLFLTTELYV